MQNPDNYSGKNSTRQLRVESDTEELFAAYISTQDPAIREMLVTKHRNLVRFLAGKFANRGEPLDDLVQVGMIGLINAVDRYDPERGNKFSTYATPTIIGEIRRYFRDKSWSLKVPRRLQELNMAANRKKEELDRQLGRTATTQEVANALGVSEEETLEAMELVNAHTAVSLDAKQKREDGNSPSTLGEYIGDLDPSLQRIETFGDLMHAMKMLDERERKIIYYRFFKEMSQTEVARRLNISQMHVSRLQQKALKKLRELLN